MDDLEAKKLIMSMAWEGFNVSHFDYNFSISHTEGKSVFGLTFRSGYTYSFEETNELFKKFLYRKTKNEEKEALKKLHDYIN